MVGLDDRIPGHVWLECNGKFWITCVFTTRDMRRVRRVLYRMCKKHRLNPRRIKDWGHQPLLGFKP